MGLKHVDLKACRVQRDAREVKTNFSNWTPADPRKNVTFEAPNNAVAVVCSPDRSIGQRRYGGNSISVESDCPKCCPRMPRDRGRLSMDHKSMKKPAFMLASGYSWISWDDELVEAAGVESLRYIDKKQLT
jgi:hypothetical protein